MQKTKEALYKSIGEVITNILDDSWNRVWVTFKVLDEGMNEMECEYETGPDKTKKAFLGGFALYDLFLELRQAMEEDGSGSWRKATLTLSISGKFDLEFEY